MTKNSVAEVAGGVTAEVGETTNVLGVDFALQLRPLNNELGSLY